MASVKRRPRVQTRRERAQATRERIVRSAGDLFAARGYTATTMAAIAARAGVAVQTVYFLFNTKAHLLAEVLDMAIAGGGPGAPGARPQPRELASGLGDEWIAPVVDTNAAVSRRLAPFIGAFRAAAAADPGLAELYRARLLRRREAMRDIARGAAARAVLRPGLDPDRAGDILFAVAGVELHEILVDVAGWSEVEWRSWVIETLTLLLR